MFQAIKRLLQKQQCHLCGVQFPKRREDTTMHGLCPTCKKRADTELLRLYNQVGGVADQSFSIPPDSDGPARVELARIGMIEIPILTGFTEHGVETAKRIGPLLPKPEALAAIAKCTCKEGEIGNSPFFHERYCELREEWIRQLYAVAETVDLVDNNEKDREFYAQAVIFLWAAYETVKNK